MTIDDLVKTVCARAKDEAMRTQTALDQREVERLARSVFDELKLALDDPSDRWKSVIPGRPILAKFAGASKLEMGRLKLAYLANVTSGGAGTFDEVVAIFADFAKAPAIAGTTVPLAPGVS